MRKEKVLDIKVGDVTGDGVEDIVVLKGRLLYKDIYTKLLLVVQDGKSKNKYKSEIDYEGYDFFVYIGDFNHDGKGEILIYGKVHGENNHVIFKIYEFIQGSFRIIFNVDNFVKRYSYIAKYEDNYLVKIKSENKYFTLYIGNINKENLKLIYNKEGRVKTKENPQVLYVNNINLNNNLEDNSLNIILYQRIIGISEEILLGFIESVITLKNNVMSLEEQYLLTEGKIEQGEESSNIDSKSIKNIIGKKIEN